MLRSEYDYESENFDSCDVCDDQQAYIVALGLMNACMRFGK